MHGAPRARTPAAKLARPAMPHAAIAARIARPPSSTAAGWTSWGLLPSEHTFPLSLRVLSANLFLLARGVEGVNTQTDTRTCFQLREAYDIFVVLGWGV